jgi:hypothetical protein
MVDPAAEGAVRIGFGADRSYPCAGQATDCRTYLG